MRREAMQVERLGPYKIRRKLGRGGMGTVYEGVHVETGESAAVKLLSAALVHEPDFRQRFQAEIDTLRKLHHPNIVRLFGFGEQEEHLYYVMELVAGSSLEEELGRGRTFFWREVTRIGIDVARALRHAHDRGVIHRDIKPGNLLMTADGHVKLSDFGIARLFGSTTHTTAGSVLGTAEFMSPEQAEGRPVGPRSDLYSLGGVFYVLLTRRPLFRGDSLPEILHKQRFEQPTPLGELAPDVPGELEQIITQLLEKDSERRIPNATVLLRRLETMEQALSLGMLAAASAPSPESTASGAGAAATARPASPPAAAAELPPTLAADSVPGVLSAGDAAAIAPAPVADTLATAAFEIAAEPPPVGSREGDSPVFAERKQGQSPPENRPVEPAAAESVKPAGRFTLVGEADLDQAEAPHAAPPRISLHTAILAFSLAVIGVLIWYFLQPATAETLFDRIEARTAGNDPESFRQAEDDIHEFLLRFPADSRCGRLRDYQQEIELDRLQRKFERRTKGLGVAESLLPVEQAYLDAMNYWRLDPERAMAKFQALLDLYDQPSARVGPTGQCLELARRQLARLRGRFDAPATEQLDLVQSRLDLADQLRRTDAARAEAMYRAVIELYAHKPWATAAVRRAQAALKSKKDSP